MVVSKSDGVKDRSSAWVATGALNGLVAVICGAFGAHVLASRLEVKALTAFETGARYQMYHALALLGVAWVMARRPGRLITASAYCMLIGVVFFSGSLYGLALAGWKWLGPVTPIGGLLMMIGWLLLAVAALRMSPKPHGAVE